MTASADTLRIDVARLGARLDALGNVGAIAGGGVCRLALSDEDRAGRDQVVAWMKALGCRSASTPLATLLACVRALRRGRP